MSRSTMLVDRRWLRPLRVHEAALVVVVLFGAYLTARMPIVAVVPSLVALDVGVLIYWFGFRARGNVPSGRPAGRAAMRLLADVMKVTGVLLILNALWLMTLGLLTQYGVTNESTTDWSALAATGFQVDPEQPVTFGARSLVVATAVWMLGIGLAKVSGGKA